MNLAQHLSTKAQSFGQKTAIKFKQQERTFSQLDQQIKKAAAVLVALHINKGDRVALLLPKGWEFIEIYLGRLESWGRHSTP